MSLKTRSYHHGDLRSALLEAAEQELAERGPEKFSLRGCAKRAGVSHAAPAHHFKDSTALLQALAGVGFARLTATMKSEQAAAAAGGGGAREAFIAAGVGYISFAVANPQLFSLMFGGHTHDFSDPDLIEHADAAFSVLVNAIARLRGQSSLRTEAGWRDVSAAWSLVHGYAHLAIANKMGYLTDRPFEEQREVIVDILDRLVSHGAIDT